MRFFDKFKSLIFGGGTIQPVTGGQTLSNLNPNTGRPVSIVKAEPGMLGERMLPSERITTRQPVRRRLER